MTLKYRLAVDSDFDKMVLLQNRYLGANLDSDQKKDGFLSGQFTSQQFKRINEDVAVIVAESREAEDGSKFKNSIVAFLCASTPELNQSSPLPRAMIGEFPTAMLEGEKLSHLHPLICGPVCVDASYRGKGLVTELYSKLFLHIADRFKAAVVFVAVDNPRSIAAHHKLGMQVVKNFHYAEKEYVIMALNL